MKRHFSFRGSSSLLKELRIEKGDCVAMGIDSYLDASNKAQPNSPCLINTLHALYSLIMNKLTIFGRNQIKCIMNLKSINWVAIIIALVATMAIGFLWYGALFLDQWAAGNGIVMDEAREVMTKDGIEHSPSAFPMIVNTISMIIYALFMNWLLNKTNMKTAVGGLTIGASIGLIMWLGIYTGNNFAFNPISLTLIDGSYTFVLWSLLGLIIGGMAKKEKTA